MDACCLVLALARVVVPTRKLSAGNNPHTLALNQGAGPAFSLLHDMGQFVGQQPSSGRRARRVLALPKDHV
jgi:hypothetical protein